jgi:hypothetical protein
MAANERQLICAWAGPGREPAHARLIQLYDLCLEQITARVMLRHVNNEGEYSRITCSVYGDLVYQLVNMPKNHPLTKSDFLKPQKLHEIQILTGKNIVTFVLRQS